MKIYTIKTIFAALVLMICLPTFATAAPATPTTPQQSPIEKPLIERYILDELKSLRTEQAALRTELVERIVQSKLENSDRAIRYTTDTTNNIFYIITAAASLLVLIGWKSVRDMKDSIQSATMNKLSKLIDSYEERLEEVEKNMKIRSNQLIATQEEISNTNKLHSLWMRAGIARNNEEKITLYDEILEMHPNDVEAMSYKADTLLDMGESKWALSLTNQAIERSKDYSFAYWQRACAHADIGNIDEAFEDLTYSLELSPVASEELQKEDFFDSLKEDARFKQLVQSAS